MKSIFISLMLIMACKCMASVEKDEDLFFWEKYEEHSAPKLQSKIPCYLLLTDKGTFILFNEHAFAIQTLNLYHRSWCGCAEKWWEKD